MFVEHPRRRLETLSALPEARLHPLEGFLGASPTMCQRMKGLAKCSLRQRYPREPLFTRRMPKGKAKKTTKSKAKTTTKATTITTTKTKRKRNEDEDEDDPRVGSAERDKNRVGKAAEKSAEYLEGTIHSNKRS